MMSKLADDRRTGNAVIINRIQQSSGNVGNLILETTVFGLTKPDERASNYSVEAELAQQRGSV